VFRTSSASGEPRKNAPDANDPGCDLVRDRVEYTLMLGLEIEEAVVRPSSRGALTGDTVFRCFENRRTVHADHWRSSILIFSFAAAARMRLLSTSACIRSTPF
jgi:hypothetical protein